MTNIILLCYGLGTAGMLKIIVPTTISTQIISIYIYIYYTLRTSFIEHLKWNKIKMIKYLCKPKARDVYAVFAKVQSASRWRTILQICGIMLILIATDIHTRLRKLHIRVHILIYTVEPALIVLTNSDRASSGLLVHSD